MKSAYIQKSKETAERTNLFCEFLVELTSAALGGKSSETSDGVGLDTGEGIEDMTPQQIEMWRGLLTPEEFEKQYGDYV